MSPTRLATLALALAGALALPAQAQDATPPPAPDAPAPDAPATDAPAPDAPAPDAPTPDAPGASDEEPAPPPVPEDAAGEDEATLADDGAPPVPPPLPPPPEPPPEPPAMPPPLPPQPTFWIEEGGAQGGPYEVDELEARIAAGTLTARTLAWTEGMADWAPAGEVEDLAALFAIPTPPDPVTPEPVTPEPVTPEPVTPEPVTPEPVTPEPTAPATPDLATYVVGGWRQQGTLMMADGNQGMADLITEFRADGSYVARGTITGGAPGMAPQAIQVSAQGRYTVQPLAGAQFSVSLTGTMQVDMGFGPQAQPIDDTTIYERVDERTVREVASGSLLTRTGP